MAGFDEAKVAAMNGEQRQTVRDALLAAFPTYARLENLLDGIDQQLDHHATPKEPLRDAVANVFKGAQADGWLPQLFAAAVKTNPGNRQLAEALGPFRDDESVHSASRGAAEGASGVGSGRGRGRGAPVVGPPPSNPEVLAALANEFPDLSAARRLVADAGMEAGRQPSWNVSSADLFWWEVHQLFVGGAVIGGWPNVLREAHRARPGHPVIAAAAAAAGVADIATADSAPTDSTTADSATGTAPRTDVPPTPDEDPDREGWDFFISYTQKDRPWAVWIAWTLEEAGYKVLVQAWDMPVGTNWAAIMQKGIEHAARTVAVLSNAYRTSVYGAAEWLAAWSADPDGQLRKLLVFRVEECERPGTLAQVVSLDLFDIPQEEAAVSIVETAQLAISGARAKPDTEPAFPGGPHTPPFPTT